MFGATVGVGAFEADPEILSVGIKHGFEGATVEGFGDIGCSFEHDYLRTR